MRRLHPRARVSLLLSMTLLLFVGPHAVAQAVFTEDPCVNVVDLDFVCSVWSARIVTPGPQITGYDWGQRWIVQGACAPVSSPRGTINPADVYVSEVYAYNTGDVDFFVESVSLEGPDASFFDLEISDPATSMRPNDRIRPFDTSSDMPKYFQRVLFRPGADERPYECEIVLRSIDGKTVRNSLRGMGIESHIESPAAVDFGALTAGENRAMSVVIPTARLDGRGSRPVTITDVSIVARDQASAGQFTITNVADIVGKTFAPPSTFDVLVSYSPTGSGPHAAELVLGGDFSPCDDSTTLLLGSPLTLSARPEGATFGSLPIASVRHDAGTDEIVVDLAATVSASSRIELFDATGALVDVLVDGRSEPSSTLRFPSGDLTAGAYYVRIRTDSRETVERVVIVR